MTRGVRKYLVSSVVLVALIGVAGCSRYLFAAREPWRRDAELACLNSGAVKETPSRVRVSSIDGPGICGISYPIKVSSLGDDAPLGYDDEPPRPPSNVPAGSMPQRCRALRRAARRASSRASSRARCRRRHRARRPINHKPTIRRRATMRRQAERRNTLRHHRRHHRRRHRARPPRRHTRRRRAPPSLRPRRQRSARRCR